MGDLLRFGRVAASFLRVGGNYRVATWLGLVLAVGWFLHGL
jgi:hypothetical protein